MNRCALPGRNPFRPAALPACLAALWLPAVLLIAPCASTPVAATEIVYRPINPSFGGDPLNGAVLLNSANAQNNKTDPSLNKSSASASTSSLAQFSDMLQRTLLSRIATSISGGLFDPTGKLIPGIVETANFSISIVDQGSGLLIITTTDKTNGQTTSFEVTQ